MKSRLLFGPVPLFIAAALFAADLLSGTHWGFLVLITVVCAGSVFEVGRAYHTESMRVPYGLATGGAIGWMLLAGLLFLGPDGILRYLSWNLFLPRNLILSYGGFMVPLHAIMGGVVLFGVRDCSPERVRGLLAGFALVVFFCVIYLQAFVLVHQFLKPTMATFWVLFIVLVNKGADTGSYFIGTWFGSHRMTPRLSPNKTWEGLAGGLASGLLISLLFALFSRIGQQPSTAVVAGTGVLLSLAGATGDLVGSLFKRGADREDSSVLFPELGGVLDISDCFLVSLPVSLPIILLIS